MSIRNKDHERQRPCGLSTVMFLVSKSLLTKPISGISKRVSEHNWRELTHNLHKYILLPSAVVLASEIFLVHYSPLPTTV